MIAKYRREGFPGEWYLTDFTMGQVEGRIADLETKNARLKDALLCVIEEAVGEWCKEDCDWPCPKSVECKLRKAINKAREVLGDAS